MATLEPPPEPAHYETIERPGQRQPPWDWRWWAGMAAVIIATTFLLLAISSYRANDALSRAGDALTGRLSERDAQITELTARLARQTLVSDCRARLASQVTDNQAAAQLSFDAMIQAVLPQPGGGPPAGLTNELIQQFNADAQAFAASSRLRQQFEKDTTQTCPIP